MNIGRTEDIMECFTGTIDVLSKVNAGIRRIEAALQAMKSA